MRYMLAALLALTFSAGALAQGKQDFTLVNKTGYDIAEVYVSPTKADEWGEDVMGRDLLEDGARVNIVFSRKEKTCRWDLKVIYDDEEEAQWANFNLCEVSVITIHYNRKTGETSAEYR